jgi:hypothetical protein
MLALEFALVLAQGRSRSRERLEQRFQVRQAAALGIRARRCQPRVWLHD